jgi:hypothetical protein
LRLLSLGIAALTIGFGFGWLAVPPGASLSETVQAKGFDSTNFESTSFESTWAALRSPAPDHARWRVASLETEAVFQPTREGRPSGSAASAEHTVIDARAVSFEDRFRALFRAPGNAPSAEAPQLSANQGSGHAAPARPVGPRVASLAPLPVVRPASLSKPQLRRAEAPEESTSSPDQDGHTAIYDISAHRVYLPNGEPLEAHSGLGSRLDDPRYVSEKGVGATPPNVYDLSLREELFHGVRALRLNPVGSGNMYGREGLLAHSYMLGPNGQSNGCVSIDNYQAFLNAFLSGEVNRLVVVDHLATPPGPKTALDWVPRTIRALFGHS